MSIDIQNDFEFIKLKLFPDVYIKTLQLNYVHMLKSGLHDL